MFDYFIVFLVFGGYIYLSYISIKYTRKWTRSINNYWRLLITSFAYALFFGIGIVASGGEPGFGFPCPIILAGTAGLFFGIPFRQFLYGVIYSFLFWWALIFLISIIRNKIKIKTTK